MALSDPNRLTSKQTSIVVPLEPVDASYDLYKTNQDIRLPPSEQLVAFRRLVCGAKMGESIHVLGDGTSEVRVRK